LYETQKGSFTVAGTDTLSKEFLAARAPVIKATLDGALSNEFKTSFDDALNRKADMFSICLGHIDLDDNYTDTDQPLLTEFFEKAQALAGDVKLHGLTAYPGQKGTYVEFHLKPFKSPGWLDRVANGLKVLHRAP
jgi:hypothetical protein